MDFVIAHAHESDLFWSQHQAQLESFLAIEQELDVSLLADFVNKRHGLFISSPHLVQFALRQVKYHAQLKSFYEWFVKAVPVELFINELQVIQRPSWKLSELIKGLINPILAQNSKITPQNGLELYQFIVKQLSSQMAKQELDRRLLDQFCHKSHQVISRQSRQLSYAEVTLYLETRLKFGIQLMKSASGQLDKRLLGLQEVVASLNVNLQKGSESVFLNILLDAHFLESLIFDPQCFRVELCQRVDKVVEFYVMSQQETFQNQPWIKSMFSLVQQDNQHRSVRHAIFDLVGRVLMEVRENNVLKVFARYLKDVQNQDEHMLQVWKALAISSSDIVMAEEVLYFLWDQCLKTDNVAAVHIIVELFRNEQIAFLREPMIRKLLDGPFSVGVVHKSILLRAILGSFGRNIVEQEKLLNMLINQYDIVKVVVRDCVMYYNQLLKIETEPPQQHRRQVEARLAILSFLGQGFLSCSLPLYDSVDLLKALWDVCIVKERSHQLIDYNFGMIATSLRSSKPHMQYCFDSLLCNLDLFYLKSETLIGTAETMFMYLNQDDSLRITVDNSNVQLDYIQGQPCGLDFFWKVVLMTDSIRAIQFLVRIYTCTKFYSQFMKRCLSELDNQDDCVLQRALNAMLQLLLATQHTFDTGTSTSSMAQDLDLYIQAPQFSTERKKLSMTSTSTLADLKKEVAAMLKVDAQLLRVMHLGRILEFDDKTLRHYNMMDGHVLLIQYRESEGLSLKTQPKLVEEVPFALLMEPVYFKKIFQLLGKLSQLISDLVWDILRILPINKESKRQLIDAVNDKSQLYSLLDVEQSPYMLLYALQIVNQLLQFDSDWTSKFLLASGLDLTCSILSWHIFNENSSTQCLLVILKMLYLLEKQQAKCIGPELKLQVASSRCFSSNMDWDVVSEALLFVLNTPDGTLPKEIISSVPNLAVKLLVVSENFDNNELNNFRFKLLRIFSDSLPTIKQEDLLTMTQLLVSNVQVLRSASFRCGVFFEFMKEVVRSINSALPYITRQKFVISMCSLLTSDADVQENLVDYQVDYFSSGIMDVLVQLLFENDELKSLAAKQFDLLNFLYHNCLFDIPSSPHSKGRCIPPRAKSEIFRKSCYCLLECLTQDNLELQTALLSVLHQKQDIDYQHQGIWEYSPQEQSKSSLSGHVGLKNLGATCYMNSLLQQLYMISEFRARILTAPIDMKTVNLSESLIYQLQKLFANLCESEKRAYDTTEFTQACTDIEGNKMNVHVQMDVDEFFNVLFDRLENLLKGTPQAAMFKELFGGQLAQQIKSKDCEHISSREESFFSLQCEVKNQRSVSDSLNHYVGEEMLDGDNQYFCGECQKHVDAVKRMCIKSLPQHLIISLKRFDFDFNTMRRLKINDFFEFPEFLNMEPFTLEFLERQSLLQSEVGSSTVTDMDAAMSPNQSMNYQLAGVLVHTGTADSGHYYSFIRDRKSNVWLHFNDSAVELFDRSKIANECYGGSAATGGRPLMKQYNAYMLFYERQDYQHDTLNVQLPPDLKRQIWDQNFAFYKDRNVFDTSYLIMVLQVLKQASQPGITSAFVYKAGQVGTRFFWNVVSHCKDLNGCQALFESLLPLYTGNSELCSWLLDVCSRQPEILQDLLLNTYLVVVRTTFAQLILHAVTSLRIIVLSKKDQPDWNDCYGFDMLNLGSFVTPKMSRSADSVQSEVKVGPSMLRFMQSLVSFQSTIRSYWKHFDEYWNLLYCIACLGDEESHFLIKRGTIKVLAQLIVDPNGLIDNSTPMRDKVNYAIVDNCKLLLSHLVLKCRLQYKSPSAVDSRPLLPYEDYQIIHLKNPENVSILMLEELDNREAGLALIEMFAHMMQEDEECYTQDLVQILEILQSYECTCHDGLYILLKQLMINMPTKAQELFNYIFACFPFMDKPQSVSKWAYCVSEAIKSIPSVADVIKANWKQYVQYYQEKIPSYKSMRALHYYIVSNILIYPVSQRIMAGEINPEDMSLIKQVETYLLGLFQQAVYAINSRIRDNSGDAFSDMFILLRQCMITPDLQQNVSSLIAEKLLSIFPTLRQWCSQDHFDRSSFEALRLFAKIAEQFPNYIKLVSDNADNWKAIVEDYEFVDEKEQTAGNMELVPVWCQLVKQCCTSQRLACRVCQRSSLGWLVENFVFLCPDSGDNNSIVIALFDLVSFLKLNFQEDLFSDVYKHNYNMDAGIFAKVVEIMIMSNEDAAFFMNSQFLCLLFASFKVLDREKDQVNLRRITKPVLLTLNDVLAKVTEPQTVKLLFTRLQRGHSLLEYIVHQVEQTEVDEAKQLVYDIHRRMQLQQQQ